ncbi:HNH endonuclease [Alsobacter sp. SYSU BS001988]
MRNRFSTKTRLALLKAFGHRCQGCQIELRPGVAWEVDHVVPLSMGGADAVDNLQILCRRCHGDKTRDDVSELARCIRIEASHWGARRPDSPLPFGRRSPWKRKLTGEIVARPRARANCADQPTE